MLLSARKEEEAVLVLWPLNLDVSTPAVDKTVLHHLEIMFLLIGPCGFTWLRSKCFDAFRKRGIRLMHSLK